MSINNINISQKKNRKTIYETHFGNKTMFVVFPD